MKSGMIGNQIIDRIINDDLVVANLTGNNPNVMYELAIRHATAKPIIHICEKRTILPFDIKDNRTAFFSDDMLGVQELQSDFKEFVKNIDYANEYLDNPIYSGMKMSIIFKDMNVNGRQTEAEILQEILDKITQESSSQSTRRIKMVYQDAAFSDANILIILAEYNPQKLETFQEVLRKTLKKNNVRYLGKSVEGICLKNEGELSFNEIKQIVEKIALRHEIKTILLENPDKKMPFGMIQKAILND